MTRTPDVRRRRWSAALAALLLVAAVQVVVQFARPGVANASVFAISQLVFSSASSGPITAPAKTMDAP